MPRSVIENWSQDWKPAKKVARKRIWLASTVGSLRILLDSRAVMSKRRVAAADLRRARQSGHPQLSDLPGEYAVFAAAVDNIAPSGDVPLPDITGIVCPPIYDIVEQAIRARLDDRTISEPMPNVDEIEGRFLPLRKRRQRQRTQARRSAFDVPRIRNWIGPSQLRAHEERCRESFGVDEIGIHRDVVLTLTVFQASHQSASNPVQTLALLGSNTLGDAAKLIHCQVEADAPGIESLLPGSHFLIEDKLYTSGSYSLQNDEQQPLGSASLSSLPIRPGSVYHFVHLGGCRHAIIFTDISLVAQDDVRNRFAYPMQTALAREKRRRCDVCDMEAAVFVAYEDRLAPTSPFFFCSLCYHRLHYVRFACVLNEWAYQGFCSG